MLFALLLALAATPQPNELRTFRDWTVGCDNGRACEAIALLPENENWEEWTTLSLRRDAAARARPVITLQSIDDEPAALFADGTRLDVSFSGTVDGFIVRPASDAALIAALRDARTLELRDAGGLTLARISPAGATAAMLFMDEAQRRVDTVTALARPGARPASAVPAPPRRPQVRPAPAATDRPIDLDADRIARLRRDASCTLDEVGGPDTHEVSQIARGQTLVLLACGTGAYNLTAIPFIAERVGGRVEIRQAPFDSQWGMAAEGRPTLINPSWDPDQRLLREYSKGRGLGDCGTSASYGWDGTRFRLVRQEEMGECRGSLYFITTWRTEVVP
ncbi:MAG: DUF1176 domain-containing protein [Allosphingosinicella sp.]